MKKLSFLIVVLSLMFIIAACGNSGANTEENNEDTANDQTNQGNNDEGLSGEVLVDGSSTVFPIMEGVAEEFSKQYPDVQASVGVSGSGGGFKVFIPGETDISNASRPIKQEEADALAENGIEYTEIELAYDGLSVVVNPENDWVDYLTVDELKSMWLDTGGVETWADVRDGWPEEPIEFYAPGTDSGTYDYWNEVILEDEQMRRNVQLSEDDNVLVQGVVGSKNAISFFGYAYYIENEDTLKIVPIENENGDIITPEFETIQSLEYSPLSRPLYTYVNHERLIEKPEVYEFIKFTLENAGELASEVGYVALPDEFYQEQMDTINDIAGK